MSTEGLAAYWTASAGALVDTNLLVLFTVGTVNRNRIESFKRTRQYTKQDYDLLVRVLGGFHRLYTLAHVLAEVSNLTDLSGSERLLARNVLKQTILSVEERVVPSVRAAEHALYSTLGLTDAAVATVAREHNLGVLTDDLDLYLALNRHGMPAVNFTHLRAQELGS